MKCPECGGKIHVGEKSCPTCGYPLQSKGTSKNKVVVIVAVLIVLVIGVIGLNYQDAKPVVEAINGIGVVTLESEEKIQTAQNRYDHLNSFQKILVTNKGRLEKAKEEFDALPIEVTPENVRKYFEFNQIFTDLNDKDLSIYSLAIFAHSASANMEVTCVPKEDKYYDGVRIVLKYDLGSVYQWSAPNVEITVGADGKGSRTENISYYGMLSPSLPSSNCKFVIVSASGNIYNKKPE